MIRLFVGWDDREQVGSHVFDSSVVHNSSAPVSITHLKKSAVAQMFGSSIQEGSNAFTMSRFLVPAMCDYSGFAIFADGADMICRGDLLDLWNLRDNGYALQVVKHQYQTRNPIKYAGTKMESANQDYDRKNWASLMLINCSNRVWRQFTPENLSRMKPLDALQFSLIPDSSIGSLPDDWNWLVDEQGPNPRAKIAHWTAGIPGFPHYAFTPHSDEWRAELRRVNHATD